LFVSEELHPISEKGHFSPMKLTTAFFSFLFCAFLLIASGCNKTTDTSMAYKAAINDYYKAHPACLWSQPKKFPVQEATSDDAKTQGYDALTDAGMLARTTGEKKVMIVASKQVNNYDVSDKGRSAWTPDSTQPGYGNFCYGHRDVTSIDNVTAGTDNSGNKTAQVNYHYKISDAAQWATAPEMKTAFPDLATALSGPQADTASLVMTDGHWQLVKQ
jgi:hypothetical protein